MKEEAEEEFISGAFGYTTFHAAKPNSSSHSGAIDMEAVNYASPDEMMSDKDIELVIKKRRMEYGGYHDEVPVLKSVKRVGDVKDSQGNHS